jgi:hypothetical protein
MAFRSATIVTTELVNCISKKGLRNGNNQSIVFDQVSMHLLQLIITAMHGSAALGKINYNVT